ALPVILKTSLNAYEEVIGIASGIFGLMYYCMIGILTFIMSIIHTGNILVFPIYTLALAIGLSILIFVNKSSYKNV
ncbi:MAG: multidrug transporter, partial [Aerococcus urinaeequi]